MIAFGISRRFPETGFARMSLECRSLPLAYSAVVRICLYREIGAAPPQWLLPDSQGGLANA